MIQHKRRQHLAKYDAYLKGFQYSKALDAVLEVATLSNNQRLNNNNNNIYYYQVYGNNKLLLLYICTGNTNPKYHKGHNKRTPLFTYTYFFVLAVIIVGLFVMFRMCIFGFKVGEVS